MSQLKPEFIYFDLDDTLLNHKKAERAGLRDIIRHFDLFNGIEEDTLLSTYHSINKKLWEAYAHGQIERPELQRRRFEETLDNLGLDKMVHDKVGSVYMDYYRTHWEWMEGAEVAYNRITSKYDVGIITNGFAETQWLKIDKFNFKESSQHIVISEEIGEMKPHPKVFDHSTKLVDIKRDQILYVGDSFSSDVVGGSKAGWQVAWFTQNPIDQGYKLANLIFDDFDDLLNALEV